MNTITTTDNTKLYVKDWGTGTLIEYDDAPHGFFATEKKRLARDLLDFLGQ